MSKTGEAWAEGEKRRQKSVRNVCSVDVDPDDLKKKTEARRESLGVQGVRTVKRQCPLGRVSSEVFAISISDPLLGRRMQVA